MITESNKQIIEEYLLWYSDDAGASAESQRTAKSMLKVFLEFYGGKELNDIEKVDITRYLTFLKTATYIPRKKGEKPKQYSPQSQFQLKSMLRGFLKWFAISEYRAPDLAPLIKLKRIPQERLKAEHITYGDCVKLIEACLNQRDRAMIAFLLDAGVRRGELLKIKYNDIKFENDGVIAFVPKGKGKKPRRVYCVWCTQEMYHWYKQHPLKTPDSYFFCSSRPPHGKFSEPGFWQQIHDISKRTGMENIHAHLFRHSSASIYAAIDGMTDQKLKYRYGWTPSSNMADVYIKLSGAESDDDIRQAFDKPVVKKKIAGKTMVTCPRCKLDNYADASRCYNCQKALSEAEIAKEKVLEEARKATEMEEMKKAMAVVAAETYKNEISKNRTDVNKHFSLEHINDKMTPAERKIILDKLLAVHKYDLEHDSEYASKFVDGTPETEEEKKKREREEKMTWEERMEWEDMH